MPTISRPSGAVSVLLLLAAPAFCAEPADLQAAFQSALTEVEGELAKGYGYCGSRTSGTAATIQLTQGGDGAAYLMVQPLSCGDSVLGVVAVSGDDVHVQVATREDAITCLEKLAGVPLSASEPDLGIDTSAHVPDAPIAEVEEAITKSVARMGSLVTVQAIRVRVDTTYSSQAQGASLYYAKQNGALRLYVLVGELLGSTKSGKPYVDVYLRGFDTSGGTIMDDGAPRSKLIKSRPWVQLQDPPDEKEYRTDEKKSRKAAVLDATAAQQEGFRQVALEGIQSELPEGGIESSDQLTIVGIQPAEEGEQHVYLLASRPDADKGGISVILARVVARDSGKEAALDRVLEANSRKVVSAVEDLQESQPAVAEHREDGKEEEPEITYPTGSDEAAEKAMRDLARSMFDADPGMRAMLRVLAGLGGKTGKSHAITVGRQASPRNPSVGTCNFLVTRTVPAIHMDSLRNWSIVDESYVTYGRVYEFSFAGGKPRERSAKKEIAKLMGRQNVE